MATEGDSKVSVLIVGAGPVGLTMACELARRGVSFRIIDKEPVPTDKSKALGIHSRTLEILESMGLVQTFLDAGHLVYGSNFNHRDKKLVHLSLDEIEGPYPFALMLPQCDTERLLRQHLTDNKIIVENGVELTAFEQTADHVKATLHHQDGQPDGRNEECTAQWIIGSDGAHSTVRHTLGFKFEGEQYHESFATCDLHVAWDRSDDELDIFVSEDGMMAFFPTGNGRYRIIADEPVVKHKTGDPITLEEAQAIVDKRGPKGVVLSDPVWMTWFAIHRRSVDQYRKDRAFLVGDAAHIHSPALGQGMNTGMQDAYNLAWKLALVEKGLADQKLLDSYQSERHPVGAKLLKTTDAVTRLATVRSPLAAGVRNQLMHLLASHEVVQHRALKNLSMLGVNYRHSPIVGEYKGSASGSVASGVVGGAGSFVGSGLSKIEGFGQKVGGALTNFGAWLDFNHGPLPGDRAPDAYLTSPTDSEAIRLFPVLANGCHNLLLFAGLKPTAACYDTMNKTAAAINAEYQKYVKVHFVVPAEELPSALNKDVDALFDEDHSFHHVYGAASPCLYLIRPDGYVGFRSHPIDLTHLRTHLQSIFDKGLADKNLTAGDTADQPVTTGR
jgi:2-polyprenyl-6-methoxyphenol hydroxylase-like FAD-dependent oxidoreductase